MGCVDMGRCFCPVHLAITPALISGLRSELLGVLRGCDNGVCESV